MVCENVGRRRAVNRYNLAVENGDRVARNRLRARAAQSDVIGKVDRPVAAAGVKLDDRVGRRFGNWSS